MRALSSIGVAGLAPLLAEEARVLALPALSVSTVPGPVSHICNMRSLGTSAIPAVPLLLPLLTNAGDYYEPDLPIRAANALGAWRVEPDLVVPVLAECVRSQKTVPRMYTVRALAEFGEQARSAVPALLEALSDSDDFVRVQATNAMMRIAPEVLTNGVVR